MAKVDQERALELMQRMKQEVFNILKDNATNASEIAVNMTDPHAPVIAFAQMALANASADYLKICGATPQECFTVTVNITGKAMQEWVGAVMRKHGIPAEQILGADTLGEESAS